MSANNQQGIEVSRRDDLEALLYMAVYMFKRNLPWKSYNPDADNIIEKHRLIGK